MEHLRWILIGIGLLILLGIILFANPNRQVKLARSRKSGARKDTNTSGHVERIEPTLDSTGDVGSHDHIGVQQPIAGLEVNEVEEPVITLGLSTDPDLTTQRVDVDGSTSEQPFQQAADTVQPSEAAAAEVADQPVENLNDHIVTLYVVAQQRHPISGVELLDAALKAGLSFGVQNIFHRLPQSSETPIFSMANLTAPGFFDRTAWNLFETQGVTLFMMLPGPTSALVAWDSMLATSERLAELLKAEVQDHNRQALTRQSIAHQREAMRNYDRQNSKV